MRLLFITIEFSVATFSGNGIYGMGQVRALRAQGHRVLVLSGRPAAAASTTDVPAEQQTIALPTWGCLDESSSWCEFAEGAGQDDIAAAVAAFQPEAALGVDWHSLGAWQRLQQHHLDSSLVQVPFFYLNYRVYSRTATGAGRKLLEQKERECAAAAALVVCLSRSDADHIRTHMMPATAARQPQVHVLLPALRADVAALPQLKTLFSSAGSQVSQQQGRSVAQSSQRRYLTCCVRLSPEKEPHRFVEVIEALARRPAIAGTSAGNVAPQAACNNRCSNGGRTVQSGNDSSSSSAGLRSVDHATAEALQGGGGGGSGGGGGQKGNRLQQLGVVPLLCGAADTEYAAELRARLRLAAPDAVIEQQFLSPMQLAEVFAATRLNIHPCAYDAFGMTIVEAASQGAPSLVATGGAVGATDLLSGAAAECFEADMSQSPEQLASEVERVLSDEAALAAVGAAAARRARSWTEDANAKQLTVIFETAMKGQALPHCAPHK